MQKLALVEMSLPGEYVVYQQQHSKESGHCEFEGYIG